MDFWRRSALLVVVAAGPCLAHCTPDFDALSAGGASAGRAGDVSIGGARAGGGSSGASSPGGQLATGGGGGTPPTSGSGGTGGGAASASGSGGIAAGSGGSDAGASADVAGAAGEQGCVTPHAGQLGYVDFDAGLVGEGFPNLLALCSMQTLQAASCSVQVDPSAGKTCPGALQLSIAFKAYPSATAEKEIAFEGLEFSFADWSQAAAMHVMVKVSPANAPIHGVKLYLMSGDNYFYASIFDGTDFKSGDWHEMVFPLFQTGLDLTKVRRTGVEIMLNDAGTAGIPAEPPPIEVLLDDVWLESK